MRWPSQTWQLDSGDFIEQSFGRAEDRLVQARPMSWHWHRIPTVYRSSTQQFQRDHSAHPLLPLNSIATSHSRFDIQSRWLASLGRERAWEACLSDAPPQATSARPTICLIRSPALDHTSCFVQTAAAKLPSRHRTRPHWLELCNRDIRRKSHLYPQRVLVL